MTLGTEPRAGLAGLRHGPDERPALAPQLAVLPAGIVQIGIWDGGRLIEVVEADLRTAWRAARTSVRRLERCRHENERTPPERAVWGVYHCYEDKGGGWRLGRHFFAAGPFEATEIHASRAGLVFRPNHPLSVVGLP